jgi:hypothetical protein
VARYGRAFRERIVARLLLSASASRRGFPRGGGQQGRLKEVLHRAVNIYRLLIIDEIGYLPMGREHGQVLAAGSITCRSLHLI